jgi:hypothetical protein
MWINNSVIISRSLFRRFMSGICCHRTTGITSQIRYKIKWCRSALVCGFLVICLVGLDFSFREVKGQQEVEQPFAKIPDSVLIATGTPPQLLMCISKDLGRMWTAPLRARPKDLLVWVPALATTGFLIGYDRPVYAEINDWEERHPFIQSTSPYITFLGDEKFVTGLFSIFYISGEVFQDDKAKETAILGFQTLFHTGLAAQVVKHISGRQRPLMSGGMEDIWHGPKGAFVRYQENENIRTYNSFFSGHSTVAWGMAAVIAGQYKEVKAVPYISYGLATLVSLSRVTEDVHWPSDILIGAFLGYQIGRYMVRNGCGRVRICPKPSPEGMEVSFIYSL